ncbi:MAG TPA: hypothetical protein VNA57_04595 [Acidimicrobiales bacterium]|nr:hypothetical protein [Acidimicrobiales bacterium]
MKSLLRRRPSIDESPAAPAFDPVELQPAPEPAPEPKPKTKAIRAPKSKRTPKSKPARVAAIRPAPAAPVAWAWVGAASVVTAGWVAATLGGWDLPFDATARGTAAASAASALVGASFRPSTRWTTVIAVATLVVLPLGLAQADGGSAPLLVATLGIAAAAELVTGLRKADERRWNRLAPVLAPAAGVACLIGGIVVDGGDGLSRPLPSGGTLAALLGVAAAALLLLAATLGPDRARPLAVPGLLIGLVAAPGLPDLAMAGAGAAAAVVWAYRAPTRPALSLAALALAAATVPAAGQAAHLLAAAAVLGLAFAHPAILLLGVPGAAGLASVLAGNEIDGPIVVVVVGAAATALVLSKAIETRTWPTPDRLGPQLLPALALAVWLALCPGTWGWTGAGGLGTYDRGALVAAAALLLALVGSRARSLAQATTSRRASR